MQRLRRRMQKRVPWNPGQRLRLCRRQTAAPETASLAGRSAQRSQQSYWVWPVHCLPRRRLTAPRAVRSRRPSLKCCSAVRRTRPRQMSSVRSVSASLRASWKKPMSRSMPCRMRPRPRQQRQQVSWNAWRAALLRKHCRRQTPERINCSRSMTSCTSGRVP